MKNFVQILLAIFVALVFGIGWPSLWAEIAMAVFALLGVFNESRRIAVIEVLLPIVIIILFHQNPNLWWLCLGISIFLFVWNVAEGVTVLKEKIR